MIKRRLLVCLLFALLFFSQLGCDSLFSSGLIQITLISNNLDHAKDKLMWTVEILNGSNSPITQFLITVDFNFSGGAGGSGIESKLFNLNANVDIGQTYSWQEEIDEIELDNSRDFAYLTTASIRELEATEFGITVARETYSGNQGKIYY